MKFEYYILETFKLGFSGDRVKLTIDELNRLGQEGWELVSLSGEFNYVLKRAINGN